MTKNPTIYRIVSPYIRKMTFMNCNYNFIEQLLESSGKFQSP
jgi:hypothetical protein